MRIIVNMDLPRRVWLLFAGVLLIVAGCGQQVEPNLHEEEVLKTLEEMRLAQEIGVNEVQKAKLGKKFLIDVRLAEHDATVDPAFIASAKMAIYHYVECLDAKRQQDELESYFEYPPDTSVQTSRPEKYHARHILLESEKEARDIIQKLDQGADFATLAREFSTGPSRHEGGELGWFTSKQMVKPFVDVAAQLEKGRYSEEPVKTQFGWHVILLEDIRPSDSLAEDIRRSESLKAEIERKKKYLEEITEKIMELCGKGDAALEKAHDLRGG